MNAHAHDMLKRQEAWGGERRTSACLSIELQTLAHTYSENEVNIMTTIVNERIEREQTAQEMEVKWKRNGT